MAGIVSQKINELINGKTQVSSNRQKDFIGEIKTKGIARNNRFTVDFSPPGASNEDKRRLLLFCEKASLPGINFSTTSNRTYGETREVGGRVNQLGGVEEDDEDEEDDEEECTCDDKENCTCGAKKKKETDGIDGGEQQASLSSGGSEVTRKGAVEVYEEYTGGTKYVVIHVKNNKLRADIIDHKLDAYNQGLNIVGDLIEVTPKDIHDTESRMRELSKLKRKKVADAKKKLAAREEAKKVIADAKEAEKQEESLPTSNTQIVKKLKEKKGKDLPQPGIHQI